MKKVMIRILKKIRFIQCFFALIGYWLLRLLFSTYRLRVTYDGVSYEQEMLPPGIFYFWHQSILSGMFFFFKTGQTGHCMVSASSDGQFVGKICERLGFTVLLGSTYKNPVAVTRQALKVLREHQRFCVVGDGSRGPAHVLQPGIEALAAKTGVPLVFVECSPNAAFTFKKSWDRFQVPYPFSTITIRLFRADNMGIIAESSRLTVRSRDDDRRDRHVC